MPDKSTESGSHAAPRLVELADLMRSCRTAFLDLSGDFHWQPVSGSQAAIDQAALSETDPNQTADGIAAGFTLVSEVVVTFLEIAAGHLAGMAALYAAGEVYFPPLPLARSTIENSARVQWVLGVPGDAAEGRLSRAYLEEFLSSEIAKRTAGHLGGNGDDIHKAAKARWKTVRERIKRAFPGASNQSLANGELNGQELPGPELGVKLMYDLLREHAGGNLDEKQAEGIYDFLSSGTHPTLYQARQLREYVDHGDHVGTRLRVEVSFLEKVCGNTVLAFYNAFGLALSYFGGPAKYHEVLTTAIDETLPGSIAS